MEFSVLSNNLKMPMMGFGVFQVTDKDVCKQSVLNAIRTGYRLIDTAAVYGNEDAVGEAVREAISEGLCTREELFITSKLWVQDMLNQDIAAAGIEASLKKSGLEYFDLYLLHQAMRDYFSAWRALEDAYEEGKLKAIGVSNFYPHVLANFCETVRVKPMVNQVELHPYFAQPEALATMKYYNVQYCRCPSKIDFSGHSALEYSTGSGRYSEIDTSTAYRRKFCYLGFLTDRERNGAN